MSAAAARIPGGIPASARGAERAFYEMADRYLDDGFQADPTLATIAGDHRFDDRLDDLSQGAIRLRIERAKHCRDEIGRVDPAALSLAARIDRDLLLNDAASTIFTFADLRPQERDPQFYVDRLGNALLYLTLDEEGSPVWPARLRGLLGRLRAIPEFLETARRNLGGPAAVVTAMVAQTNAGNLDLVKNGLPSLYGRDPALRGDLLRAGEAAAAALRSFQSFIEGDLRDRSTGDWRLGTDLWSRKLRLTLQSDLTPEVILERATMMLAEVRGRMLEAARPLHDRLHPGHRHTERGDALIDVIVGEVLAEVTRRHSTPGSLFADARAAVDRVKRFIRDTGFIGLPPESDNFAIEPTPGFLDGTAVAFFNPPPTLEPGLKKSFWISSVPRGESPEADRALQESFLREYNHYALECLTIHEAFPGHYVQYWHALASPIASLYKKIFASGTFAEGWAVLIETLMFEAGYGAADPATRLIHLKQLLRVPINALLDARLHTTPMSDDEADRWALDLMTRRGFQEEAEARGKLRRAKVGATQLSTYFVGYLELSDLLKEARAVQGTAFDRRAWCEALLACGTIPPRAARRLMLPDGRAQASDHRH